MVACAVERDTAHGLAEEDRSADSPPASPSSLRVLIVDDEPDDAWLAQSGLRRINPNMQVDTIADFDAAVVALTSRRYDAGIIDYHLGAHSGVELIARCRAEGAEMPLILVTGQGGLDVDLDAMRGGATDYLSKDEATPALLERSLRYGLERVASTAAMLALQRRYEAAVEGSHDGIWDWDLGTGEFHLSRRFKEMLGFDDATLPDSPEAWVGSIHPDDREMVQSALARHLAGWTPALSVEHRVIHRDGSVRWVYLRGRAQRDAQDRSERVAGSQTDITSRKLAQVEAQHRATHDPLTGLANRALLLGRLQQNAQRVQRTAAAFAVLYLDLDGFKEVNDVHGHASGDSVLVEVANRLRHTVASGDFVARIGGDEFVAVLNACNDVADARLVAAAIEAAIERPFSVRSGAVSIGVSVGIRVVDNPELEPDALLDAADREMYSVKLARRAEAGGYAANQGGGGPSLEADFHSALRGHTVVAHYQPIVDAKTRQTVGYEALARWTDRARGTVSPLEFVPVAERTGLITELGRQMLVQACAWAAPRSGHPRVSVNIAAAHLSSSTFIDDIERALGSSGLSAGRLHLEITEHTRLVADARIVETLAGLVARGVRVDIDDFGTGYSSFDLILRLPISALKVDRSLVAGVGADERKQRLLRHLVAIGHSFDLTVTAEGVEAEDEWEAAVECGVDHIQGYLFGGPEARTGSAMPLAEIASSG